MVCNMVKTTKYSQRVDTLIDLLRKDITNSIISGNERLKEITFGDIKKLAEALVKSGWQKPFEKPKKAKVVIADSEKTVVDDSMFG